MTIRQSINPERLNSFLTLAEACAENAPQGSYETERKAVKLIGWLADELIVQARELGLKAPNCDQIREVESVVYGYLRDANPEAFAAAEGFGAAMDTPARERVIRQAKEEVQFLAKLAELNA